MVPFGCLRTCRSLRRIEACRKQLCDGSASFVSGSSGPEDGRPCSSRPTTRAGRKEDPMVDRKDLDPPEKPPRRPWIRMMRFCQGCLPILRALWLIALLLHDHDDPETGNPS